jgi:hypothetical protein
MDGDSHGPFEKVREKKDINYIEKDAIPQEEDSEYRFYLQRKWNEEDGTACVVLLNPSTASATDRDHTITKLSRAMYMLGFGELEVVNLFPVRSPYPGAIKEINDPLGQSHEIDNDEIIRKVSHNADGIFVAWGTNGVQYGDRIREVLDILPVQPYILGENSSGKLMHGGRMGEYYSMIDPKPYNHNK